MPIPSKPSYSHGSTGTEPGSSLDYTNGDPLDANNLDHFVYVPFSKISATIDYLNEIDSDGDGTVDAADTAATADAVKGNDIDSNGDGTVDAADRVETGGSAATIRDTTNSQDLLVANEGGPIDMAVTLSMGDSLSMSSNNITGVGRLKPSGDMVLDTSGGGSTQIELYDQANSTTMMKVPEGGPFEIVSRDMQVSWGDIEVGEWAGGDVRITGELTENASL